MEAPLSSSGLEEERYRNIRKEYNVM